MADQGDGSVDIQMHNLFESISSCLYELMILVKAINSCNHLALRYMPTEPSPLLRIRTVTYLCELVQTQIGLMLR